MSGVGFLAIHPHNSYGCSQIEDALTAEAEEADRVYYALETDLGGEPTDLPPVTDLEGYRVDDVKGGLQPEEAEKLAREYDTVRIGGAFFDECVRHGVKTLYDAAKTHEYDLTVEVVTDATIYENKGKKHVFADLFTHTEPVIRKGVWQRAAEYADLFYDEHHGEDWMQRHAEECWTNIRNAEPGDMNEALSSFIAPFLEDEPFSFQFTSTTE